MARPYRAIEAYAQFRLKSQYTIITSDVKFESLPEALQTEYVGKYRDDRDGKIKLPLYATYRLLKEKSDKLGLSFFEIYNHTLKNLLDIRNGSILAHGFAPVREQTFQSMYEAILSFTGIEESRLPFFPVFKL